MAPIGQNGEALVSVEVAGATATIRLQRPPFNQFNEAMLRQLDAAIAAIEADGQISVVRISSKQRAFSGGADPAMMQSLVGSAGGATKMMDIVTYWHKVNDRLAALPAITIAEIAGHAFGGGFELALACDLRVAREDVKLGLPEVKAGLLPGAGGTQRLTRLCGPGVASRLIFGAELVNGRDAEQLGLVQWAMSDDKLVEFVDSLVGRISALSPAALRQSKACIREACPLRPEGVRAEISGIGTLMTTSEAAQNVFSL